LSGCAARAGTDGITLDGWTLASVEAHNLRLEAIASRLGASGFSYSTSIR